MYYLLKNNFITFHSELNFPKGLLKDSCFKVKVLRKFSPNLRVVVLVEGLLINYDQKRAREHISPKTGPR